MTGPTTTGPTTTGPTTTGPVMAGPVMAGQVVVVTGGGHGIGAAIATAAAEAGATVALLDVDGEAAAGTARRIGAAASWEAVDVTDESAVETALDEIVIRHGVPAVLVNNAALTRTRPNTAVGGAALELAIDQWRRVLDVNLTGAFICARSVARRMAQADGGLILNVASVQGLVPTEGFTDYCVSKAGLIMMTKCLAGELAGHRIRVNAVAPGPIRFDEVDQDWSTDATDGSWGTPADVAAAVLFLAGPGGRYINGHVLSVDGGVAMRYRRPPARPNARTS